MKSLPPLLLLLSLVASPARADVAGDVAVFNGLAAYKTVYVNQS